MRTRLPFALLLCFGLLAALAGCKEDEPGPQLPAETQSGKNTLGFKIGTRIYIAKDVRAITYGDNIFELAGGNSNENWGVGLGADSVISLGVYLIDTVSLNNGGSNVAIGFFDDGSCQHLTYPPYNGSMEVTYLDQNKRIIAGRFRMQLFSNKCNKTTEVIEGRFDLKF
jgi:hypothetical protein